jgi:plastocyanin
VTTIHSRIRAAALALAVGGVLAACPTTITVAPGAKVTFVNRDQTAHTATSNKPAFDTGTVRPGKSSRVTLSKPGKYTYYCQFHAFMHGTVVVR